MIAVLPAGAAERYPVDWSKAGAESLARFTELLQIDTSNPPGNETRAATYLKQVLEKEGISCKLLALEPDRANLVARLKGNGSKRPLLIMGHTDVVGVQEDKWSFNPFTPIRKDGYIYARGAVDDKDNATAALMVMILLKRLNVKLDRDVIFLAEAGEEGTTKVGIDFLVEHHWNEIAAEFALAEGGGTSARNGKVRYVGISATEKAPRPVKLVARGHAGHGSRPTSDNAVLRLAAAVAKVGEWQPPMRLNDTTRAYFKRLAAISTPEEARRYNQINDPAAAPAIERYFAQHESGHNAILRTTVVPTIIKAGFRSNVIPSEAEATLDVRILPDEDMERFYGELRRVIGDPNVQVVPSKNRGRPVGRPSRLDTEMFHALEQTQRRMFPGAITLPTMSGGATDMAQLRARGVEAYGFGPIVDERDAHGAHSDDERIAAGSIPKLVEFLWYAVLEVAAAR
ncbi:MAG TPA: M20/M25/M40 family metallo-hydrolase [Bryobacteraceae bacterium]|nr:M20/M25/M40 family metallo-hydrolase [Bryobacteraceae bacterium]